MIHNKKSRFRVFGFMLISLVVLVLGSCRKDDFDEPPINGDNPNLKANITIDSLKKYWKTGELYTITEDWIIAGVVVADDKSGNYYKTIVIEDSTAGISIRLDVGGFYGTYPVGRNLYVKCKGLILGDYGGLIQLGGYIDNSSGTPTAATIPSNLVSKHFFPGKWNQQRPPAVVTIAELKANRNKWQNRLIQINDVEFIPGDTNQVWADVVNQVSKNRTFQECGGTDQAIVRTSSFADFAGTKTPNKNGSLVGIFTIFNSDNQIVIRDLNDVALMTNNYCGDGPGPGAVSEGFDYITTPGNAVSIPGWLNVAVQGNKVWLGKTFNTEKFAEATAFQSSLPNMETWLITPSFDISAGADTLSFKSQLAFYKHDGLTVWISTNFTGLAADISTATWTQLTFTRPPNSPNYVWTKSGDISLTGFTGTAYIGFKYMGDGTNNTTTYRVDNVRVR